MNILLVNAEPLDRGHHPTYVGALHDELVSLGHDVAVVAPDDRLGHAPWQRRVGSTARTIRASQRWLRHSVAPVLRRLRIDLVWETYADTIRFRMSRQYTHLLRPTKLLVTVHSPRPLVNARGSLAASRLQRISNGRLRRLLGTTPAIVHTPRDIDELRRVSLAARALPWPVCDQAHNARPPGSRPRLLFVGEARRQKGLEVLIDALKSARWDGEFRWVGGGPDAHHVLAAQLGASIDWSVRPEELSSNELAFEYRHTDIVALPYSAQFAARGGASSILLEALSHGRVVVGTQHAIETLRCTPAGTFAADGDDAASIARCLRGLVTDWRTHLEAAVDAGPRYVQQHGHSYGRYVRAALTMAAMGGDERHGARALS